MQWLKRFQESGKSEVYFISACCVLLTACSPRSKLLAFIIRSVSILVLFSLPTLQEISVQKYQVCCARIIGSLEHFQTEIDSDHRKKRSTFSEYYFWPLIREIRRTGFFLHVNDTFSVLFWSRWSIPQLQARYSFGVQTKEQKRREFSEDYRPLSKLDELCTQHRYSMDRWTRLMFTPTEVHFMRLIDGDKTEVWLKPNASIANNTFFFIRFFVEPSRFYRLFGCLPTNILLLSAPIDPLHLFFFLSRIRVYRGLVRLFGALSICGILISPLSLSKEKWRRPISIPFTTSMVADVLNQFA